MSRMKFILALVIAMVTAGGLYAGFRNEPAETPTPSPVPSDTTVSPAPSLTTYEEASLGLAFTYKTGTDGYTLFSGTGDSAVGQLASLLLVHENERPMIENPVAYSEGPISITVSVFENTKKQFPRQWAVEHDAYSNFSLMTGAEAETVVGGANALRYTVDGLYRFDTVVVAHGSKMYVLAASYHDTTSATYRDFGPLLASVRFIREPGQ